MLECNRSMKKKFALMTRVIAVLLPVIILTVLLSQSVFALNTYVINDGEMIAVHTTFATNPAEVLSEAGFELTPDDIYTTQTSSGKSEITIQRQQTITIRTPQTETQMQTYGETVAELLERAGIVLTEDDVVSARLNGLTHDGMEIIITSNKFAIETYPIEIPYETLYFYVPSLPEGQQVVLSQGAVGTAEITANVLYIDGNEISRTILSDTVVTEPVREIVATSDQSSASPAGISQQLDQLQQTALAGMPVIYNGVIITPNGEVLTYSSTDTYKATAYNSNDPGCNMWTATGTMCRIGVVAVDPRMIPYGTQMYIVSNDGKYVYGISSAEDCGGAIKNKRIDLYFETLSDCLKFGVRDCTIYFLN